MSNGPDSVVTRSRLQSALISLKGKVPWDDTVAREYSGIKGLFSREMFGAFDKYKTGSISASQLRNEWNDLVKKYYPLAYQKGMEIGKAPWEYGKFDKAWVTQAVNHEKTFVNKFIRDIEKGEGLMPYDKRLEMYVDTLDGIRNNGYFEAMPDRVEITWVCDEDESSCPDCLELAANSPYTKYALPAFPRAGETQCLSNCRCYLDVEVLPESEAPPTGPQTVTRDRELEEKYKEYFQREIPEGYDLPNMEDKLFLDDKFYQIYQLNQKIEAEVDRAAKLVLMKERKALNQSAIEYMKEKNVYYVRPWEPQPLKRGTGLIKPPKVMAQKEIPIILPGNVKPEEKK